MISKNSKTFDPHRLTIDLSDKNVYRGLIKMFTCQISGSTTHGKIKTSRRNNKFEISISIWNDKFEL